MDYEKIRNIIVNELKNLKYSAIYLFGSYANECQDEYSDIDIGLITDYDIDPLAISNLTEKLSKLLNKEVDLVNINYKNDKLNYLLLGDIVNGVLLDENEDVLGYLMDNFITDEIEDIRFLLFGDEIYE